MAKRIYSSTTAAPISPAVDASWEVSSLLVRSKATLDPSLFDATKDGVLFVGSGVANQDTAGFQLVLGPLAAQTITGTVKGQLGTREANAATDARAQVVVRTIAPDATTVRGTNLASDVAVLANEFPVSAGARTNRQFPRGGAVALTSVAVTEGDYLVTEVGFRNHGTNTGAVRWGFGTGSTDAPIDETTDFATPTLLRGWIEFSQNIALLISGSFTANAVIKRTISRNTYALDGFNRVAVDSWGSADIGGAYTLQGTAANFDVTGSVGTVISPAAGNTRSGYLDSGEMFTDCKGLVRYKTDKASAVGHQWGYVLLRRRNPGASERAYEIKFRRGTDNLGWIGVSKLTPTETALMTEVQVPSYVNGPDSEVWIRYELEGVSPTTIRVKAWEVGDAEPGAWQGDFTDSDVDLQQAGNAGLRFYVGAAATNAPVLHTVDEWTLYALQQPLVDAVLKKTVTGSFTANAIIKKTTDAGSATSFSGNAVFKKTINTGFFGVYAVLQKTPTGSFAADAVIAITTGTRLRVSDSAPAVAPLFGGFNAPVGPWDTAEWDGVVSHVHALTLGTAGLETTATAASSVFGAANKDYGWDQFVSDPLAAGAIGGAGWWLKGQIRAREGAAGVDGRAQVFAAIISNDGQTVRGTLLAFDTDALASEFAVSASVYTNRQFPRGIGDALTQITVQEGDRLLIVVGARAHGTAVNTLAADYGGAAGADLAEDETTTAAGRAWFQFSKFLAWLITGTFTADAVLQKTTSSSFTANAVIRKQATGSFTADAIIKKTVAGSSTADAVLKKTASGSLTANAALKKTIAGTGTVDAVLKKTVAGSSTADAVLKKTVASSFTADGIIKKAGAGSATTDAVLKKIVASSGTADAVVARVASTSVLFDPNDSLFGELVTFRFVLSGPFPLGNPTGTVQFRRDGVDLDDPVDVGIEADATLEISTLPVGEAVYDAVYSGDDTYLGSTSNTIVHRVVSVVAESITADAITKKTILFTQDPVLIWDIILGDYVLAGYRPAQFTLDAWLVTGLVVVPASFTADAILRQATSGSVTANAILRQVVSAAPTANAVLFKTVAGSFTASAWILGVGVSGFSVDAVLKKAIAVTITADAVIVRGQLATVTADAVLKKTASGSFSADAVLLRTQTATPTADALLRRAATGAFVADAIALLVTPGSFTADARILSVGASGFSVDAVLLRSQAASPTVDAVLKKLTTTTFTADGVTRLVVPGSFIGDAILYRLQTNTHTADGVLRRTQAAVFAADAVISTAGAATLTADAVISRTSTEAPTADAVVKRGISASFAADALINLHVDAQLSANALIFRTASATFAANSWIAGTGVSGFTLDAVIRAAISGSITLNALTRAERLASVIGDAILLAPRSQGAVADATILAGRTGVLAADGIVVAERGASFSANAVLRTVPVGSLTVNANVIVRAQASYTANALLRVLRQGTGTADAVLRQASSASFSASAFIERVGSGAFSTDAVLRRTQPGSVSANAITYRQAVQTATADARLRILVSGSFTAGAQLVGTGVATITANAVIFAAGQGGFSANAILDYNVLPPIGAITTILSIEATTTILAIEAVTTIAALEAVTTVISNEAETTIEEIDYLDD